MATIDNGILGGFKGKVGTVVGYTYCGKNIMRSRPVAYNDRNSDKQQKCRSRLATLSRLASTMKGAWSIGMRHEAALFQRTARSHFMSLNNQAVGYAEQSEKVDFSDIMVSQGTLARVVFENMEMTTERMIRAKYRDSNEGEGRMDDYVYLYLFNESLAEGVLSKPSLRYEEEIEAETPQHWAEGTIHVYGFTYDHIEKASESIYMGMITL